ncbi:MAG: STAS domain-containing protein [Acidimicrobiales bacterium]
MITSTHFSIAIGRALGAVVVTVHGNLDVAGSRHLDSVLADLIDGQGNLAVVVDLQDASAAGASGPSVLAAAADRAARRGTDLSLSDPPELLHQALELSGLGALVRTTRRDGQRRSPAPEPDRAARAQGRAAHPAGTATSQFPRLAPDMTRGR